MTKCIKLSICGPCYTQQAKQKIQSDFLKNFCMNLDFEPIFVFQSALAIKESKSLTGQHVIATVQFSASQAALMDTDMAQSVCEKLAKAIRATDEDSAISCEYLVSGPNHIKLPETKVA